MPFEYCEFSGAACSKQEKDVKDPTQASVVQQNEHEQQLSDELQEKTAINEAKRGGAKKDGAKPVCTAFQLTLKVCTFQPFLTYNRSVHCGTALAAKCWGLEHSS